MLDIDDPAQLALSDRRGWLRRAGRPQERWRSAIARGRAHAQTLPPSLPVGTDVIWLDLPPTLRGIGMLVQALYTGSTPPILLWRSDLARLPLVGAWFTVGETPRRPGVFQHSLDDLLDPEEHPALILLALLSLLDSFLKNNIADQAVALSAQNLQALAQCVPDVSRQENPAKQLGQAFSERLPIFWAHPPLAGAALDWRQRIILYAETRAEWSSAKTLRAVDAMVRFPRYWPQTGVFVQLGAVDASTQSALEILWQRRRIGTMRIAPPVADAPAAQALYLLELGEWTCLYSAALLGLDPAERTALDFLDALSDSDGRA